MKAPDTRSVKALQERLCATFCANSRVATRKDGTFQVTMPLAFPDGDAFMVYLKPQAGGFRATDMGHTVMHLSYEMDVDKLRDQESTRALLLSRVVAETGVREENGELFVETAADDIGRALFRLAQAMTRVHDISFLNRQRVETTFYEDLKAAVLEAAAGKSVDTDYVVPELGTSGQDYTVDFHLKGSQRSLFIYGAPNDDKVKLVTIKLLTFQRSSVDFDSIIVFADQEKIRRGDLARLSNVGGEQVSSLDHMDTLREKIKRRVA